MKRPEFVFSFSVAAAALLFVCGCKTTSVVAETRHEVRYNPNTRVFTFAKGNHPPFFPGEIAKALQKAGVQPDDEIRVNMHRLHDQVLITEIATQLSNNGFRRYVFCTDQVAESRGSFLRPYDKPPATAPPREGDRRFLK